MTVQKPEKFPIIITQDEKQILSNAVDILSQIVSKMEEYSGIRLEHTSSGYEFLFEGLEGISVLLEELVNNLPDTMVIS